MTKYQQYLAFYRDFRFRGADVYESCPILIHDLGLYETWCDAYHSYYYRKWAIDPLTLPLRKRLERRKHPLAYAA